MGVVYELPYLRKPATDNGRLTGRPSERKDGAVQKKYESSNSLAFRNVQSIRVQSLFSQKKHGTIKNVQSFSSNTRLHQGQRNCAQNIAYI